MVCTPDDNEVDAVRIQRGLLGGSRNHRDSREVRQLLQGNGSHCSVRLDREDLRAPVGEQARQLAGAGTDIRHNSWYADLSHQSVHGLKGVLRCAPLVGVRGFRLQV